MVKRSHCFSLNGFFVRSSLYRVPRFHRSDEIGTISEYRQIALDASDFVSWLLGSLPL